MTQEAVRAIALALPDAHEHQHRGRPDLDLLVSTDPDTYRDVWGGTWVAVDLVRVTKTDLRRLLVTAWRLAAPKRLRAEHPTR